MNIERKRSNRIFLLACIGFVLVLGIRFWGNQVNAINSTMLAFSYEYGFISRGLIGTIYQGIDWLLPIDMESYTAVMWFTKSVTTLFFVVVFVFFAACLGKVEERSYKKMQTLILFYLMFAAPFFVTKYNFGRLDLYMLMLSILGVLLLIWERAEWLVIPIVAVATMVHQGYVFMFFNIILVLIFAKCCDSIGKQRRKYITILVIAFLVASALFLWFELFSHVNGEAAYEEVVSRALAMSSDGKTIHTDVIDKEILGIDLTSREVQYHLQNAVQFPVFLVLVSPYLVIGFGFMRGLVNGAKNRVEKLKYLAFSIGPLTILPDLLLKVDFGRWMFVIVSYYLIVSMAFLGMGDRHFTNQVETLRRKLLARPGLAIMLFVYPFVLQPFCDVSICHVTASIAGAINDTFLHWW